MDQVNLLAFNTVPFVLSRLMVGWGLLYDFPAGSFTMQLRREPSRSIVHYTWSTANGRIEIAAVPAEGRITLTAPPAEGDTISLGNTTITYVASGATGNQIAVSETVSQAASALTSFLQGSADAEIAKADYSRTQNTVGILSKVTGDFGNASAMAATGDAISVSAPFLRNGGHVLTITAPAEDIATFSGIYTYDCRFSDENSPEAILFGGSLTFQQGVTR